MQISTLASGTMNRGGEGVSFILNSSIHSLPFFNPLPLDTLLPFIYFLICSGGGYLKFRILQRSRKHIDISYGGFGHRFLVFPHRDSPVTNSSPEAYLYIFSKRLIRDLNSLEIKL